MPDKNRFQAVVESTVVGSLAARDYKGVGSQYVDEGKVIVEDAGVVGSLQARDYKGVNHEGARDGKLIVEPYVKSRRAQSSTDNETWVEGEINPTLNSFDMGDTRATTAIIEPVLFENSYRDGARIAKEGVTQTLSAKMGTGGGNTPMIAIGIQGTVIGRQDHNGPGGKGHTEEDDPMFTLTSTDVHAVIQYDGYNQRVNESDVSLTIRIGRDSSDFIAQPTEPTVFQPGTMVRLGGGVWDGTVPTLRAEAKRGDNEPHIAIHSGEPTMAVRRLTPLECERLMGWPDDHTRYNPDGSEQADTHRYKQCGNGVASPVARWIAQHLLNIPRNPA